MTDPHENFKEELALTLETIFDDLKQHSKELAQNCVLPTESLEIKINPMFNDMCPSIEVTYNFIPNQERIYKILEARNACFRRETDENPS